MSNRGGARSASDAVAALEAALNELAGGLDPDVSAEEQLELIARLRRAAGRATSLVSVWVAEADRSGVARRGAGTTMTDWLSRQEKADGGEARGVLNEGKSLLASPELRNAATSGKVSPNQLRGIKKTMRELPEGLTRQQRKEAARSLVDRAKTMTPSELGRQAEAITAEVAPEQVPDREARVRKLERQRQRAIQRRCFAFVSDGDGSLLINGSLPTLEGEKFRRLVAGYAAADRAKRDGTTDHRSRRQRDADALIALLDNHGAGASLPGLAGDRPRLVVTISESDLSARLEQAGVLSSGEQIDPGSLRRLGCDAEVLPVVLGGNSEILDVGRSRRTVTPEMRLALSVRDGGCRFPGCDAPDEVSEAHHISPWWASGATAIYNLVLLCPHHHALVEPPRFFDGPRPDQWVVVMVDGQPDFRPPKVLGRAESRPAGPPPPMSRTG